MILLWQLLLRCIISSSWGRGWLALRSNNRICMGYRTLNTVSTTPAYDCWVIQSITVQRWQMATSTTAQAAILLHACHTRNRNARLGRHPLLVKGCNPWIWARWIIQLLWHQGNTFCKRRFLWQYRRWYNGRRSRVWLNGTHRIKCSMRTVFTWGHRSLKLASTGGQKGWTTTCVCSVLTEVGLNRKLEPLCRTEDVLQLMTVFSRDLF